MAACAPLRVQRLTARRLRVAEDAVLHRSRGLLRVDHDRCEEQEKERRRDKRRSENASGVWHAPHCRTGGGLNHEGHEGLATKDTKTTKSVSFCDLRVDVFAFFVVKASESLTPRI